MTPDPDAFKEMDAYIGADPKASEAAANADGPQSENSNRRGSREARCDQAGDEVKLPLEHRSQLAAGDAEEARRIFQDIAKHARDHRDEVRRASQGIQEAIFAASPPDVQERRRTSEWTAVCDAHAAAIEPLKMQIDGNMNEVVLAALWDRNQEFLKQIATFDLSAQDLECKGRPHLLQSLKVWKHDTEATNALIQYVRNSRQPGNLAVPKTAIPAAQPAAALDKQTLLGIWDIQCADGRRAELALDDRNFSYLLSDGTYGYWGAWTFEPVSGGGSYLCIARTGIYPAKYYGPLGQVTLTYQEKEAWGITAFEADKISFGSVCMTRRGRIPLPVVSARISEVVALLKAADARDQSNSAAFNAQASAIASAQAAMATHISNWRLR